MSRTQRFLTQLAHVRRISEGMLKDFETPEQWTHQVCPQANHALWFAGHMGVSDNFFLSLLDGKQKVDALAMRQLFGMGSQPTDDPAAYPPVAEVLDFMRERRQTLLALVATLSDDDLDEALPPGTPEMWTDKASVIESVIWHEGMHSGQLSIARRALGHSPLMGAAPPAKQPQA